MHTLLWYYSNTAEEMVLVKSTKPNQTTYSLAKKNCQTPGHVPTCPLAGDVTVIQSDSKIRATFIFMITSANVVQFSIFFSLLNSERICGKGGIKTITSLKSVAALPCETLRCQVYSFTAQIIKFKVMENDKLWQIFTMDAISLFFYTD